MTPEQLARAAAEAFATMGAGPGGPGPGDLRHRLSLTAEFHGWSLTAEDFDQFRSWLFGDDVSIAPRRIFEMMLHLWDHADAPWASETKPNSLPRRSRVYELLGFSPVDRAHADRLFPARVDQQEPVLIVDEAKDWYTPEREAEQQYYWRAYTRALQAQTWPASSIERLDTASRNVVANLADPAQQEICQTKGLVVGYVQSGKTANFTAVIAKAVDAGYRLIIVLAGTLDILRRQTQKRLDRELLGKENVRLNVPAGEVHDYALDDDWRQFLEHSGLPSEQGAFDWHRLTGSALDYESLRRGLPALEFERRYSDRRVNDRENLRGMTARLVVVKKHPLVLKKVLADLKGLVKTPLDEIPALVIDDESDQASINTRPLTKKERRTRTETNRRIVELLAALRRAQYIGYTATPFANVFIDPDDAEDLFPKDYIETLPRPEGYMGVSDFFDLGGAKPEGFDSNERAYVRDIRGDDSEALNLPKALDAFVIAGAIKLQRESTSTKWKFKHHTMLVHRSHRMKAHTDDAEVVRRAWEKASFLSSTGLERLSKLYEEDFLPVSDCKAEAGSPPLPPFPSLIPFLERCIAKVGDRPALIVNGEHQDDTPDFDKTPIWKVIVGGTKLSRGYTIEGLTVSYYRRPTGAADTLMQMGRWFGFRGGYRDLVRLFLGREERIPKRKKGQPETIDLLDGFKSICLDEEEFREKLAYLAKENEPRIRPRQVPPLVPGHLLLRPTSRNKMFNARVVSDNFGGRWFMSTLAPTLSREKKVNEALLRELVSGTKLWRETIVAPGFGESDYVVGIVGPDRIDQFISRYLWSKPSGIEAVRAFCQGANGDPGVSQWIFMAPQVEAERAGWRANGFDFRIVKRSRDSIVGDRFKAYTDPGHVAVTDSLVDEQGQRLVCSDRLRSVLKRGTAAFLFYPCREPDVSEVSMGFNLRFPLNSLPKRVYFSVRKNVDTIVVPAA